LIAGTLLVGWVVDSGLRLWRRGEDARQRQAAALVLRANGMEKHTYLPSFGAEPGALADALMAFDFTNELVLDKDGRLAGRLLPKLQPNGPGLRLVVVNTK
jgi:hypothetical protein